VPAESDLRVHRVEVAANHVAQLAVPFALFTPQPAASGQQGSSAYAAPWLPAFLVALLGGNRAVLRLLRHNAFPHAPPAWAWGDRTFVGDYIPPVTKAPKKVKTGIY
jgi:hypothetical protein